MSILLSLQRLVAHHHGKLNSSLPPEAKTETDETMQYAPNILWCRFHAVNVKT
jgi:hypothetical protein